MTETILEEKPETLPLELVSQMGLAAIAGVSKQRISQLKEVGKLPEPFGIIDGQREVWTRQQAEEFVEERSNS